VYRENYVNAPWDMASETIWRPPTDVYETDSSVVVIIEIAGLGPNDYQVLLRGRTLVVTGERRDAEEKLAYQQMEIRHGKFRTQVHLPWALQSSGQSATYENGFIKITLPKASRRRVPVRATTGEMTGTNEASEVE
jgi:HSP20 family protein